MAFRVLIIGGSVAGLTLANILEQYGIDYLLLEKYDAIAPQLGASIALLPYGMQIMDQIGLLNRLLDIGEGVDCTLLRGPAAERLKDFDMFGDWLEELFGTRMTFMERQQLVQVLYDHLKDKSKVLTSCAVQTIDQTDGQVQVTTTNGDVFSGQLVVGADGVHSRVREEMWRHEAMSNLRFDVEEMRRSITCTYRCMFGISPKPEQHILNHTFKVYHHNASYLCADGPMGNMYWFAFFKNERQTTGRDIPRYTAEDEAALLAERGGDALFNDIKFKDLYESRSRATLVPLEEFVLEKSFHKRVVLIGDSFHKMLPLIGHGGNSAIESAALLADLLMDELQQNKSPPTNASIERALSTFDRRRRPRTRALQQASLDLQQLEALEDPVKKFMMLRVASSLPFEKLALLGYIQSVTPSHTLHYLPAPTRKGRFPFTDGGVQVDERPTSVTLTSCILLLTLALIGYFTSQKAISDSIIPVYALWVVESYRPAFLLSPLSFPPLFLLAGYYLTWNIATPLYAALHLYTTSSWAIYYPMPRKIDLRVARALPFLLPLLITTPILTSLPITPPQVCLILSITLALLTRAIPKTKNTTVTDRLFGQEDVPWLSLSYVLAFFWSSVQHMTTVLRERELSPHLAVPLLTVLVWCAVGAWDLRRLRITDASLVGVLSELVLGGVVVGPVAVLLAFWRWREFVLARALPDRV